MSETYTVKQVAKLLGYSTNSIYTFLKEGRIKGVRLGKGRFRISGEELRRVMHLSKKLEAQSEVPVVRIETVPSQQVKIEEPVLKEAKIFDENSINYSDLFDWFLGITSILIGCSFFLYNQYLDTAKIQPFLVWITVLQSSFIAGGIAVLLTNLLGDSISKVWRRLFHSFLILAYFGFSFLRFQIGDGGGAVLFGVLAVALIIDFAFTVKKVSGFLIFIITLSIVTPIAYLLKVSMFDVPPSISDLINKSYLFVYVWCLVGTLSGIIVIWAKMRSKLIFRSMMILYGFIFLAISYWFINNLAWAKSFLLTMTGLTSFIVPLWDELNLSDKKEKKRIIPLLLATLVFVFMSIGVLWVLENNIKEYAGREIKNKVSYGKILVGQALEQAKQTTLDIANNSLLASTLSEKDKDSLDNLLKLAFSGNQFIRRILILKPNGDLFTIYPYTTLTASNFAVRDYFIKAIQAKGVYISDSFESTAQDKRIVVAISAPIFDKENNLIAVVVSSVDTDNLGLRLQENANFSNGEYFEVFDNGGNRIIHPDRSLIGPDGESYSKLKNSVNDKNIIVEGYNFEGIRVYQNFQMLDNGWIIKIDAPVNKVLAPTRTASIILFFSAFALVIFCAFYFFFFRRARS